MENQKICFVIMGFGKRQDPSNHRMIDLDYTYKKIIKPAVAANGFICIRGDEISDSALIDRSMYALLLNAELVIADISTYNPNAIYELGFRHAVKPYSTIIIQEEDGNIPFDINHNRIFKYKHAGVEISKNEELRCIKELSGIINNVTNNRIIDSPLYTVMPNVIQPILSVEEFKQIIGDLSKKENTIYSKMELAKQHMKDNNFVEASLNWKKLSEMVPNEIFFIQQWALCTYKSEKPALLVALTNALNILNKIDPDNDTETLGIKGAINKNLWKVTSEVEYLNIAVEVYKKGWNLFNDYYTAENYAHCIEQKALIEKDDSMKIYYQQEALITRRKIVEILLPSIEAELIEHEDLKWKFATLSNCYKALKNDEEADKFENKFKEQNPLDWELKTFTTSKNEIIKSINSNNN